MCYYLSKLSDILLTNCFAEEIIVEVYTKKRQKGNKLYLHSPYSVISFPYYGFEVVFKIESGLVFEVEFANRETATAGGQSCI